MCIPCVMCGACMDSSKLAADLQYETSCPECGCAVSQDDISCPQCPTLLSTNVLLQRRRRDEG